jgi:hypothetical protein
MINISLINDTQKYEYNIELNQIVSKPIETLEYSKYTNSNSTDIEYFQSKEINSEDNLELESLHWKAAQNRNLRETEVNSTKNNVINSEYRDLYITNIVQRNSKEGIEIPIWSRHKRKNIKEVYFSCLKNGTSLEVEEGFVLVEGKVYTNYSNEFDPQKGEYRIYFLSGVTESGENFNELLNTVPAIPQLSFENISLETGEILEDSYEIIQNGNRFTYVIKKPNTPCLDENISDTLYYKPKESNVIELKKPDVYGMENPWSLKITNGNFIRDGKRYWVPEFKRQPFDGQYGTIRLIEKRCRIVTESIIKLPVESIYIDPKELVNIDVIIADQSEKVTKALTTNVNKLGTKYSDSNIEFEEGILSWDESYGIIELGSSFDPSSIIKASFYYQTEGYIIKEIDVNFFNNPILVNNKIYFYLMPDMAQDQKSIQYLIVDEEDRIIDCSDSRLKPLVEANFNQNNIVGKTLEEFREKYCLGYQNEKQYLELGLLSLKEDYYLDESLRIEIKKDEYIDKKEIKSFYNRQHKALQSKFGYGEEGQKIQKNNLIYVEYPIDMLETYGGVYKEKDLIRYSKRKLTPGVDLVVNYSYPKSELKFKVNEDSIVIDISWEGPGRYSLYKNTIEDAESLNSEDEITPIFTVDSFEKEELSFVDSAIEAKTTYWYSVRINEYLKSNKYGVRSK